MTAKKQVFYRMTMAERFGYQSPKKQILHAGTAIAAVQATGQQVFAEVVMDDKDLLWTHYYTLNPEGM